MYARLDKERMMGQFESQLWDVLEKGGFEKMSQEDLNEAFNEVSMTGAAVTKPDPNLIQFQAYFRGLRRKLVGNSPAIHNMSAGYTHYSSWLSQYMAYSDTLMARKAHDEMQVHLTSSSASVRTLLTSSSATVRTLTSSPASVCTLILKSQEEMEDCMPGCEAQDDPMARHTETRGWCPSAL
jgi:hypothetical protein